MLHMTIAPHYKQFCHVVQSFLSCEAKLLHMICFAPQTMSAASVTTIMYAWDSSKHVEFHSQLQSQILLQSPN